MKKIIFSACFCFLFLSLNAQVGELKKPSTLAFHLFYYDFNTAQQIKATSLADVLNNGKWSSFKEMQLGFGLDYLKGLNQTFDLVTTLNGAGINYLFKDGSLNGSSKFLLDLNIGANAKLLNDSHAVSPYLFAGAGFSYYNKKTGFFFPVGAGAQFNLFNEAFILTNFQYRIAATKHVNDHFYYEVGIGLPIGRKKKAEVIKTPVVEPVKLVVVDQVIKKDIRIKVIDEPTKIALAAVNVTLKSAAAEFNAVSDYNGEVVFKAIAAGNYDIKGLLNGISTSVEILQANNFNSSLTEIPITLLHNDPRFTLAGIVDEKSSHKPIGAANIHVSNQTNGNKEIIQNNVDGTFNIPLDRESDYIFSAQKVNYLSDIYSVSTKGLNRSTTLYVKLSLAIEETKPNTIIALRNIYYQTGSTSINQEASSDLDKLVLFLTDNPQVTIEIASHSDSRGDAGKNLILSARRAQEVVNYLQKHGINRNRLIAKGYGETRLINGCKDGVKCSEAQHEQNRRTEFRIVG